MASHRPRKPQPWPAPSRTTVVAMGAILASLAWQLAESYSGRCLACPDPPERVTVRCKTIAEDPTWQWVQATVTTCQLENRAPANPLVPSAWELEAARQAQDDAVSNEDDPDEDRQLARWPLEDEDSNDDDDNDASTAGDTATLVGGILGGISAVGGGVGLILRHIYQRGVVAGTVTAAMDPELHDHINVGAHGVRSTYRLVAGKRPAMSQRNRSYERRSTAYDEDHPIYANSSKTRHNSG